jgi:hypothetical protein
MLILSKSKTYDYTNKALMEDHHVSTPARKQQNDPRKQETDFNSVPTKVNMSAQKLKILRLYLEGKKKQKKSMADEILEGLAEIDAAIEEERRKERLEMEKIYNLFWRR